MAPSGVPILRPPANALPPGTEWQATQSPARATYSPLLSAVAAPCACASGAAPSTNRATARRFTRRKSGRARRQVVIHDRQAADALAGDGEDRVRHRGHDWRRRGFADAAPGGAAARHDVDVDLRRLGEAHHAVGVEIALLRHAVLHGDLSIKRGAEPEDRAALHLLGDGERVHDIVRIDGDRDAIHLELALGRDGDLRDMGAEASHVVADGDAAPLAFRQRLAPVALLSDGVEHLEPVELALQQLAPELVGILTAYRGDLVDEALEREDVLVFS